MYDSEKISNMIKTLEEHSYSYTHYKHQNGEGCINTEILLKQLKLNETEIRAKAIAEFAEQYKKENVAPKVYERIFRMVQLGESDFKEVTNYIDSLYCDLADKVAEQMKTGGIDG